MKSDNLGNSLKNLQSWQLQRQAATENPGLFHGELAKRRIFWFESGLNAWVRRDPNGPGWSGFDAKTGRPLAQVALPPEHEPWRRAFNDEEFPFYRWFEGGLTNACFNEVDAHFLAGHGAETALIYEGERWDPAAEDGKGGPVTVRKVSRKELFFETARHALVLRQLGLQKGDRIALNMPNILEQIFYIEAAKRLGIIYTCIFGGFSAKTLAERIVDSGARVVITTDGAFRNGQSIRYKQEFTDEALARYLAVDSVSHVIVVQHTREANLPWNPARDRWSHELLAAADEELGRGQAVPKPLNLLTGPDEALIAAVYGCIPPVVVSGEFPLFICYTSGSTGAPKGLVHVHGAYVAGIAHTMEVCFGLNAPLDETDPAKSGKNVIYVVADPGWITGQSYMISAALTTRTTSVIAECAPVFPHAGRFASIIERHQVTVFKAATTFLRAAASNPANLEEILKYRRSSVKVATFCAEPVSPAIQEFAMAHVTPNYINSYWATEHGGIVLTHFFGATEFPLRPDAHAYALPWIFADVWVPEGAPEANNGQGQTHRSANFGEKGELVLTRPYPYLARTIWGDGANVLSPKWKGDLRRYSEFYFERWAKPGNGAAGRERVFTQGDYACKYEDGSLSLHGRSDEVIKVGGHRIGTEEIEGALLQDGNRVIGNVVVVGAPHAELGSVPVAFVMTTKGATLSEEDVRRLSELVRVEKGEAAVPSAFISVKQLPETRSGKYLRRILKDLLAGEAPGDVSSLKNPESLSEVTAAISEWQNGVRLLSNAQKGAVAPDGELARIVAALERPQEKRDAVLTYLRQLLAQVLTAGNSRTVEAAEVAVDKALREIGLTSLKALNFSRLVKSAIGPESDKSFSVTTIFNYPTLTGIADYLTQDVLGQRTEPARAAKVRSQGESEPLAVIGMACRFPGDVSSPESFWELLRQGKSGITSIPATRWKSADHYAEDRNLPGKMYVRHGGFLGKVDEFDAQFFGISPVEALALDPQHRLLLETAWEALERAGIRPASLEGTRTGVFIGITTSEYAELLADSPDRSTVDMYVPTGNKLNTASGRISYVLGTHGPSMSVDTACSSSLVAIHLACQSIQAGESEMAIVGGVNLMLTPDFTVALCKTGALSPEGLCKTFDESADGYVRSDGCGMVVLKRFSQAIADGDLISAVILGSAVNHDGKSNGLTAPNGKAQEELLREALSQSHVLAAEVSFLETHGTGTPLGDPVEAEAIAHVYREGRAVGNPLILGAVKTNIGHTESAAGIAGFIKTVLCLKQAQIPPVLHFKKVNSRIAISDVPAKINTELLPWEAHGKRRIAGVSAFGFSGTNAHVVVAEAPARPLGESSRPERPVHFLALSAKEKPALVALAQSYEDYFSRHPGASLGDVCATAALGRNHFEERLAVTARTVEEMQAKLHRYRKGEAVDAGVFYGRAPEGSPTPTAFLFSGQGSQYPGMGKELYETQPVFRQVLDRCEKILRNYLKLSLTEVLYGAAGASIDQTEYTQPVLFSFEIALFELWRSWGVEPAAVMGHSVGECVAACAAGVFSLEDGLKLIAHRGRLMQQMEGKGAMGAVSVSEATVIEAIARLGAESSRVSIAAVNGPESVVIAGDRPVVEQVLARFEEWGVRVNRLKVSHAFHSAQMDPMLEEFERIAQEVKFSRPKIPLISNLTGRRVSGDEVCNASYWRRQVREPVRFADVMNELFSQGIRTFVEMGPGTTLCGLGQLCEPQGGSGGASHWNPSLKKDRGELEQLSETVASLYPRGILVDWSAWEKGGPARPRLELPTYPFQRQRHWAQASRGSEQTSSRDHSPLGLELEVSGTGELVFEFGHGGTGDEFLSEFQIHGKSFVPASVHLARVLLAGTQVYGKNPLMLESVEFGEPMVVAETESHFAQLILSPDLTHGYRFRISSRRVKPEKGPWVNHVTGVLSALTGSDVAESVALDTVRSFVKLPELKGKWHAHFPLAPSMIEAAFQEVLSLQENQKKENGSFLIPVRIARFVHYQTVKNLWSHTRKTLTPVVAGHSLLQADVRLFDHQAGLVGALTGLCMLPEISTKVAGNSLVATVTGTPAAEPGLIEMLDRAQPEERLGMLIQFLQREIGRAMGRAAGELIEPDQNLLRLGMDSMLAVRIRNNLMSTLGERFQAVVPLTIAFRHPTIQALAKFLDSKLFSDKERAKRAA